MRRQLILKKLSFWRHVLELLYLHLLNVTTYIINTTY